jgi:hypothetical protein
MGSNIFTSRWKAAHDSNSETVRVAPAARLPVVAAEKEPFEAPLLKVVAGKRGTPVNPRETS